MALTIRVVSAPDDGPAVLCFDLPRLVVGRGDGCDVRLPDPSVSHRHCSIRQRGAEHVLIDEGSTNGTFVGRLRIPSQSPHVIRSGDLVRVGRVWLEVRMDPSALAQAGAAAARELALRLVTAGLASQDEDARPRLTVAKGPDAGKELVIAETGRPYVIGRGKDADLAVDDESASRRHVDVALAGDHVVVRDLGSKTGARLGEAPVTETGTTWRGEQLLQVGANQLRLEHPAAEALAALERSPDERIGPNERFNPPEPVRPTEEVGGASGGANAGGSAADAETPDPPPNDLGRRGNEAADAADLTEAPKSGRALGLTDFAVILVALVVLAVSGAGLWLLLGR